MISGYALRLEGIGLVQKHAIFESLAWINWGKSPLAVAQLFVA